MEVARNDACNGRSSPHFRSLFPGLCALTIILSPSIMVDAAIKIFPSASRPSVTMCFARRFLSASVSWKEKENKKKTNLTPTCNATFANDTHRLIQRKLQTAIVNFIPGERFTVEYSCLDINESADSTRLNVQLLFCASKYARCVYFCSTVSNGSCHQSPFQ